MPNPPTSPYREQMAQVVNKKPLGLKHANVSRRSSLRRQVLQTNFVRVTQNQSPPFASNELRMSTENLMSSDEEKQSRRSKLRNAMLSVMNQRKIRVNSRRLDRLDPQMYNPLRENTVTGKRRSSKSHKFVKKQLTQMFTSKKNDLVDPNELHLASLDLSDKEDYFSQPPMKKGKMEVRPNPPAAPILQRKNYTIAVNSSNEECSF